MVEMPEQRPTPGIAQTLSHGVQCILAPNPSPMTYWGTNTYIVGKKTVAVIDPGPDDADHLAALLAAIDGREVSHLLVTHSHLDHSALARRLSDVTGASIYGFGDSNTGRSPLMQRLANSGLTGGGEGVDHSFVPDVLIADGETLSGDGWQLTALHTPGHFGNHMCFCADTHAFTGDLVMGWASSLVSPPDGDLTAFLTSCEKLRGRSAEIFFSGHGAPIGNPAERLQWLMTHRQNRTSQIMATLADGPATIDSLAARIYHDVDPALLPAAARNIFAHLIALSDAGKVRAQPDLNFDAEFELSVIAT